MANNNKSDFIDINALFRSYLSKWYWFVLSIAFCVLLGYLYTRKFPRKMAVRANVLIEQENSSPMAALGGMSSLFGSNGKVDDEIFVIGSHSLYRNVVKELDINKIHYVRDGFMKAHLAYPEFPVDVVAPGVADTLGTGIYFTISVNKDGKADIKAKANKKTIADESGVTLPTLLKTEYGDFKVTTTPSYKKGKNLKTVVTFSSYDEAAENLSEFVHSDIASKKGNVINLSVDTPNPLYGKDILNKIIEKYNERGVNEKNIQGEKTATFLESRIKLLAEDLKESETALQSYKEDNGLVDVYAEAKYQIEKRGVVETAMLEIEQQIALLKYTRDFLADTTNYTELIPVTVGNVTTTGKNGSSTNKNAAVQDGISAYNDLVLRRLKLSQNARPNNYAIKELSKQMNVLRKNIRESSEKALENANIALREIKSEKGATENRIGSFPKQEREFTEMYRQREVKQSIYLFLLQKQEENAMLLANAVPKGHIVDEAFVLTRPLGMSRMMVLALAFMFGLVMPPVLLYLRKLLRNKFETREEVEKQVSAPVLGEMCVDRSGRSLVVSETDTSSATELFRLMRTNLLFMLGNADDKVVLVTSTRSGEGKSFISLNLAATLSLLEGKKVLLVGMDIRNPQLANYIGINPVLGLTNYLSSPDVKIDAIIEKVPGIKNLDVIVAGPIPPNPAELLASKNVDNLFAQLRTMYDYIVIDSAPVGMVSDTFTLNRLSNATVYVTRVNYSTMSDLRFIENVYDEKRLNNLSVVVNGTPSKKGYGYGYGRDHKK